ncbi:MAG: AAA family ATPase [Solirubrobacterales bacterium]
MDDAEQVLVYLDTGEVVSSDTRGKATIDTFELNRGRLVRERAVAIEQINWDIGQVGEAMGAGNDILLLQLLRDLYDPTKPLAALRRQRVNQWVQFRPRKIEAALWEATGSTDALDQLVGDLKRVTNKTKEEETLAFFGEAAQFYLSPSRVVEPRVQPPEIHRPRRQTEFSRPTRLRGQKPWTYLDSAEIRSIEIRNFRAIEHISLEMTEGPGEGSWLMLLGENGTGKSSILQAIALVLSDAKTIEAYAKEARHLLRKGAGWGQIRVELTGKRRFRELRFGADYQGFEADQPMEGVLVAGYGATRLLPRSPRAPVTGSKIDSLFDPFMPLSRPSAWLPELEEEQFDAVARALKRLLNLSAAETMRLVDGDIYLTKGRQRLRLADLSDGYQAMAGFGLDLMELFLRRWGSLEAAEGVVLVDELGAHLHPRWQMQVTGLLRAAFPRVQFVATTHDPLCLQGLRNGEVALLRRSGDHVYALHHELPPIEGLAVDQILTSEHFGLHSTRDPAVEELLNEYYSLLAGRKRNASVEKRLQELRAQLDSYHLLGTTRRERLALQAADEFIAAQPLLTSAEEYMDLRVDTVQRIRAIWESRLR